MYPQLPNIVKISNKDMQRVAGIYLLIRQDVIVYVGQSTNMPHRVTLHAQHSISAGVRKDFDHAICVPLDRCRHNLVENALIRTLRPEYNGKQPSKHDPDAMLSVPNRSNLSDDEVVSKFFSGANIDLDVNIRSSLDCSVLA